MLALALALGAAAPALASATHLSETGSTLLYPLMTEWVKSYTQAHGDIDISTEPSGSGKGISDAVSGAVQIGASDAYMSDKQIAAAPLLNIPVAVSGQFVAYNVPAVGDAHIKLSGPVLAGIYSGAIHSWDDPQIVALNKDLASKLPHTDVVPIHRSDASGDTFIFTQYLAYSTPSWAKDPGFGTRIPWPGGTKGQGAVQNAGVVDLCRNVNGGIAYVGISFLDQADSSHLGYAALQNRDGKFVLPSNESLGAAVAGMLDKMPKDGRISLVYGPGANAYPLTNFEYAIVRATQPSKDVADALAKFLGWVVSPAGGNATSYLGRVHFIPLPESVLKISQSQVAQIK